LKKLKCKHPCVGICGEKCPKLCRICNKDELQEIFFGTEDEPDARFIELKCGHIFEVSGLDGWFDSASQDNNEVQTLKCPRCKSIVRDSLRYGNILRMSAQDIENVKLKYNSSQADIEINVAKLLGRAENHLDKSKGRFIKFLSERGHYSSNAVLSTVEIIMKTVQQLDKAEKCIYEFGAEEDKKAISSLRESILSNIGWRSQQELHEMNCEVDRIYLYSRLLKIHHKTKQRSITTHTEISENVERIEILLKPTQTALTEKDKKVCRLLIEKLESRLNINCKALSLEEKATIVKAMALAKGHWFKCPNGHIYAIGECGGAVETSKCPECKAEIGGERHTLTQGNQVATEMDGATHGAWSQHADNMLNYEDMQF